jgi:hypothetical protein
VTEDEIKFLKDHDHQTVLLHLKDGEVVKAKILFVSETEQDVIVDLISCTNIARYQKDDVQPTYQYLFKDIKSVEPDPEKRS